MHNSDEAEHVTRVKGREKSRSASEEMGLAVPTAFPPTCRTPQAPPAMQLRGDSRMTEKTQTSSSFHRQTSETGSCAGNEGAASKQLNDATICFCRTATCWKIANGLIYATRELINLSVALRDLPCLVKPSRLQELLIQLVDAFNTARC